jgi:hypothetical protein
MRPRVPVDDITFFILEVPWDDDQNISFADPDLFLDFALGPSHPGDAIEAPHTDVVCAHHQFCTPEHLAVPLLREFYPYNFSRGFRSFFAIELFVICQYDLSFLLTPHVRVTCPDFVLGRNIIIP